MNECKTVRNLGGQTATRWEVKVVNQGNSHDRNYFYLRVFHKYRITDINALAFDPHTPLVKSNNCTINRKLKSIYGESGANQSNIKQLLLI